MVVVDVGHWDDGSEGCVVVGDFVIAGRGHDTESMSVWVAVWVRIGLTPEGDGQGARASRDLGAGIDTPCLHV